MTMKVASFVFESLRENMTFTKVIVGVMVVAITIFFTILLRIAIRRGFDSLATGDDDSDSDSWKPSPDDDDDPNDLNLDATFDSDEDDGIDLAGTAPTLLVQSIMFPWAILVVVLTQLLNTVERELRTNALDMSPLIVVTGTAYRSRIRPGINTKLRASDTDSEIWDKIREVWAQCRSKGCGVRARNSLANNVPWTLGLAYEYTAARLAKVLTFMSVNDNRWADLVMNARVINGVPFRMTQYTATRNFATGPKQTDDYFVFDNVASDTRWVMDFYGFFMQLSSRYGATLEQARYIAAVAAINAIAVSYGVDPNDGGHGAIPGNHGFVEPHRFPDPFRRRGH